MLPSGDAKLVQIVDAALADAAARSGDWLACRPGCNQCCTGVFRVSGLDAARLRAGRNVLRTTQPEAASALEQRVRESVERLAFDYPGDAVTGLLSDDEDSVERFEEFANEEVCPVLDPVTGTCTMYAHRPLTCRTFGPPVRTGEGGFGVCELCFVGAPVDVVAAAEMMLPPDELEARLMREGGLGGDTIVAFALGY